MHNIIATCCGEYIDSLIFEAQDAKSDDVRVSPSNDPVTDVVESGDSLSQHGNPIMALLQVSHQVREITLGTLSQGMCIPRQADGRLVSSLQGDCSLMSPLWPRISLD